MSAAPSESTIDGVTLPVGGETITSASIRSLSISIENTAGQTIESDDYFALPDLSGKISGTDENSVLAALGAGDAWNKSDNSGNYYVTTYAYGDGGNLDRVQNPDGTIDRTVFDTLGRETSEWVGTDDTTGADPEADYWWSPANAGGIGNMVEVAAYVYDNGGAGDSNLTETIAFPDGNQLGNTDAAADFRVSETLFDFQDQPIATKSGVLVSEVSAETSARSPSTACRSRHPIRPTPAGCSTTRRANRATRPPSGRSCSTSTTISAR